MHGVRLWVAAVLVGALWLWLWLLQLQLRPPEAPPDHASTNNHIVLLDRWAVTCDPGAAACAWTRVESIQIDTPSFPLTCVSGWDSSRAVVLAYVTGHDVFAAVPVWNDLGGARTCVVGGSGVAATTAREDVLFVRAYDDAAASLLPGYAVAQQHTVTRNMDVTNVVDQATMKVVPLATGEPRRSLPWGAWKAPTAMARFIPANCSGIQSVYDYHLCDDNTRFGLFAEDPLRSHPLPKPDWRWVAAQEHTSLSACLRSHELYFVGDSIHRQVSRLLAFIKRHPDYSSAQGCSARPFPPASALPHTHNIMARKLQSNEPEQSSDLAFYLNYTLGPWEPQLDSSATPVLVLTSGLWNLKDDATLTNFERTFDLLLEKTLHATRFERVIVTTTTALHPFHKKFDPAKTHLTTTRTDALNHIIRQTIARHTHPKLSLLDWSLLSGSAPWGTVPLDAVHYCTTVHHEHVQLLLKHVCMS